MSVMEVVMCVCVCMWLGGCLGGWGGGGGRGGMVRREESIRQVTSPTPSELSPVSVRASVVVGAQLYCWLVAKLYCWLVAGPPAACPLTGC